MVRAERACASSCRVRDRNHPGSARLEPVASSRTAKCTVYICQNPGPWMWGDRPGSTCTWEGRTAVSGQATTTVQHEHHQHIVLYASYGEHKQAGDTAWSETADASPVRQTSGDSSHRSFQQTQHSLAFFSCAQKKKTPARAAFVGLHSSQGHQNLIIVTDLVSAGKLKILLLKYFKQDNIINKFMLVFPISIGGRAILKK